MDNKPTLMVCTRTVTGEPGTAFSHRVYFTEGKTYKVHTNEYGERFAYDNYDKLFHIDPNIPEDFEPKISTFIY